MNRPSVLSYSNEVAPRRRRKREMRLKTALRFTIVVLMASGLFNARADTRGQQRLRAQTIHSGGGPCEVSPASDILKYHSPKTAERRASFRRQPIFVFYTDEFWLNLHHFLYVLGRAENKTRDAGRVAVAKAPADEEEGLTKLTPEEQKVWREAVSAYASTISKKDLVFDAPLPAITAGLAAAKDAKALKGTAIDAAVTAVLERAAPLYRKAWWPAHHEANRRWHIQMQPLLAQHGETILKFVTNAYQLNWAPGGFAVHVTAYSNWAGAYSTEGNLLVLSSLNQETTGLYGLETIFHEGMHQWDDQVLRALKNAAEKLNAKVPNGLSHALIFFTAGAAVKRAVPDHVPYADKFGVWQRGMERLKPVVEQVWRPYLSGNGTRDEAFARLIESLSH